MKNINMLGVGMMVMGVMVLSGCGQWMVGKPNMNISGNKLTNQELIEQAFWAKYPSWQKDEVVIKIDEIKGDFASGLVNGTKELGGAAWLAVRDGGVWQIVWDGNGMVMCSEIELYDFPTDLVKSCYDDEREMVVDRSDSRSNDNLINEDEGLLREAMVSYLTEGELSEMTVNQIDGNYAKGSLSLVGDAGGWWLAYKESGAWLIVATGSDVVDCDLVEKYGFPTDMVTVCYDLQNNESKIRVTMNDLDKILTEVSVNLGFEMGTIEDTVFEWQGYSDLIRIKARGVGLNGVNWSSMTGKLSEFDYYVDESNMSENLFGFFVRDNVVCELYRYSAGNVYLSCGVI